MNSFPNFSEMSVSEYVDFIELRAIHTGVDAEELNIDIFFENMLISEEMYEKAKWELVTRDMVFAHYGEY